MRCATITPPPGTVAKPGDRSLIIWDDSATVRMGPRREQPSDEDQFADRWEDDVGEWFELGSVPDPR
jgi:hypothetical protein